MSIEGQEQYMGNKELDEEDLVEHRSDLIDNELDRLLREFAEKFDIQRGMVKNVEKYSTKTLEEIRKLLDDILTLTHYPEK